MTARPPIPGGFICPITQHVFEDPVLCCDGNTYERQAIQTWLQQPRAIDDATGLPLPPRSPLTNLPLPHVELIENRALRQSIEAWFEHYPEMRIKPPRVELRNVQAMIEAMESDSSGKQRRWRAELEGAQRRIAELEQQLLESAKRRIADLEQQLAERVRNRKNKWTNATGIIIEHLPEDMSTSFELKGFVKS